MLRIPLRTIGSRITLAALFFLSLTCRRQQGVEVHLSSADSLRIINEIIAHRAAADSFFRHDPASPFKQDITARYEGVKWFAPNVSYYFASKLFRYDKPDTVIILGTKGEERTHLKYGYFVLPFGGEEHRLNVYKSVRSAGRSPISSEYLSVWFTDETTGKETYQVGRYVDVGEEHPDPSHLYTIDLNKAYNPYCAYTPLYSCAVPRREDHLDFAVRAGELKYHQ